MRVKYTITIKTNSAPSEVAATNLMTKFFDAVKDSHLKDPELSIVREDLPEETLEEAIERVSKKETENK